MKQLLTIILIAIFAFGISNCNAQKKKKEKEKLVLIKTSAGDIKVKLYNETPKHRDNFLKLVGENYYNDILFHRIIKNFMIQAGDPASKGAAAGVQLGNGGPDYTIEAEFNDKLFHKKGALAAARMGDNVNPKKESSGSQFYIVQGEVLDEAKIELFQQRMNKTFSAEQIEAYKTLGGTPHLDGGYTVFGEVVEGLDIIDKIAEAKTDKANRPLEDIKIISMKVVRK